MAKDITFTTRLAAVVGLAADASEEQIFTRVQKLSQDASRRDVSNERELRIQGIMSGANCSRDQAIHVLSQQDAEDAKAKAAQAVTGRK
jgi:hypothetical protein